METITSTNNRALMTKKTWKIMSIIFQLVKKGISSTNLFLLHLQLLLKRGNKLAGKAIESLLLTLTHHNHHEIYCSSITRNDVSRSFAGHKEYEFSCSSSPAFQLISLYKKSKLRRRHHIDHRRCRYHVEEASVAAAVQRVFDMLNSEAAATAEGAGSAAATPMLLPGFGKSPAAPVRQLRVTDSPFPVKENEEEAVQVSKAAEEFIRKFYRALKGETSSPAVDTPYHTPLSDLRFLN